MIKQEFILVETDEQIDDVVNLCSLVNTLGFGTKELRQFLKDAIPGETCRCIGVYENRHPIGCLIMSAPTLLAPHIFILAAYFMPEFANKQIVDAAIRLIDDYAMECGVTSVIAETKRFQFYGWKRYGFRIRSVTIERNVF